MQFRERSLSVLCVRNTYNPETKKMVGKTVATQPKYTTILAPEVEESLEPDEIEQLKKWLENKSKKIKESTYSYKLSSLGETLKQGAEALDAGYSLDQEQVEELLDGLDELKKSLRKAGIKITRSSRTKKQSSSNAVDDRQLDIENDT